MVLNKTLFVCNLELIRKYHCFSLLFFIISVCCVSFLFCLFAYCLLMLKLIILIRKQILRIMMMKMNDSNISTRLIKRNIIVVLVFVLIVQILKQGDLFDFYNENELMNLLISLKKKQTILN